MIYTITFNPALDYIVHVENISIGETNRSLSEQMYMGGKGINVSYILQQLGYDNTALGFVAGFTGEELKRKMKESGICEDFITTHEGMTRINVKVKGAQETEINCAGPHIMKKDIDALLGKLSFLQNDDILILSGSVPQGIQETIYEDIMGFLENKGVLFIVDATRELLMNVLKYRPFLIKPNNFELGELFNVKLSSIDDITYYARKLQDMGARNVLVSMAKDGSLLVDEEGKVHRLGVYKGVVKNSVGAGDSMVAGFVAGYLNHHNYEEALHLGTAAGGATAFHDQLATKEEIDELLNNGVIVHV